MIIAKQGDSLLASSNIRVPHIPIRQLHGTWRENVAVCRVLVRNGNEVSLHNMFSAEFRMPKVSGRKLCLRLLLFVEQTR